MQDAGNSKNGSGSRQIQPNPGSGSTPLIMNYVYQKVNISRVFGVCPLWQLDLTVNIINPKGIEGGGV